MRKLSDDDVQEHPRLSTECHECLYDDCKNTLE